MNFSPPLSQTMLGNQSTHTQREYFPYFDFLRIALATAVAIGHAGLPVWHYTGAFAVQIFFALSGWLIGGILLKATSPDLPRFYFNRAMRIWIPYFVAITLLMAASLLKDRITIKWFEFFFYDLTFVYNFFGPPQLASSKSLMPLDGTGNHFWSICAEEQFYLVAPLLLTIIPAALSRSILAWTTISLVAYLSPFAYYFGAISLGVLAAVIADRYGHWHLCRPAVFVLSTVLCVSVAVLTLDTQVQTVLAGIAAISIVLLLARPGRPSHVGTFLGGMSYPMYLNHWIGIFVANAVAKPLGMAGSLIPKLASIPLSLAAAAVLYVWVDRAVMSRRNSFYTPARGAFAAIFGAVLVTIGLVGGILVFQAPM